MMVPLGAMLAACMRFIPGGVQKAAEYCFVDACHDLGAYTFQYGRLSGREVLALGHGMEDFLYDWEVGIGFEEGAESVG